MPVPYHPEHAFLKQATPEALRTMPWLYPHFVSEEGHLRLSIHALVVKAPGLNLVVDTCIATTNRARCWGPRHALGVSRQSRCRGMPRDAVDTVVCTHLHVDHVGWNTMLQDGKWVPTFPNARYLIGRREFEHWSAKATRNSRPS